MAEPTSLRSVASPVLDLRTFALAAIASAVARVGTSAESSEASFLRAQLEAIGDDGRWPSMLKRYLRQPAAVDAPLIELGSKLSLNIAESLTAALVIAVETDLMAGRAIARIQEPVGGSRPTLGLLSVAFAGLNEVDQKPFATLLTGPARESGLLTLLNEGAPLAERPIAVPLPLCLALLGHDSNWPGAVVGMGDVPPAGLPPSVRIEAARRAQTLAKSESTIRALVVRSSSPSEARSVACAIAGALGRRAAFIENASSLAGLAPWLILRKLLPVFCFEIAPGERKAIPALPHYSGPILALGGREGSVEFGGEPLGQWTIEVPSRDERRSLWTAATGDPGIAAELARHYRHGSGRIAQLGRAVRYHADLAGHDRIESADIIAASRGGESAGLDALAQSLPEHVPDEALITTPTLRAELERLYLRCRARDGLADGLGISTATRYQPGVRALFTGSSGTGKTLAAGWLATRLGLPLYRVDLASVTSKYIGETEKNLAQLLARAEHAEVVLLFDEADSLFARRTEIREANDRFANAQTNYLLQRIETFDGIAILTANSRARFDSAFARRLDAAIEFPLPGPEQRRALWQSHLGDRHALSMAELNQLAVVADICGGNIRNAVLAAAVLAQAADRVIAYPDVIEGLANEYRKLGRQIPVSLTR